MSREHGRRVDKMEGTVSPNGHNDPSFYPHLVKHGELVLDGFLRRFGWCLEALGDAGVEGKTIPEFNYLEAHALSTLDQTGFIMALILINSNDTDREIYAAGQPSRHIWEEIEAAWRASYLAALGIQGDLSQRINAEDWNYFRTWANPKYNQYLAERAREAAENQTSDSPE